MTKSAKKIEKNEGVAGTLLAQLMLPLAEIVRGDLRELVIALGMRAVAVMIEEERTALCGPRCRASGKLVIPLPRRLVARARWAA